MTQDVRADHLALQKSMGEKCAQISHFWPVLSNFLGFAYSQGLGTRDSGLRDTATWNYGIALWGEGGGAGNFRGARAYGVTLTKGQRIKRQRRDNLRDGHCGLVGVAGNKR